MNETVAITLNLSNLDSIAKIWNVGGKDLGLPVIRPKLVLPLLNEAPIKLYPEFLFFNSEGQKGNTAINFLSEDTNNNEAENRVRTEIENLNANFSAYPIKVNKIKIYTDNTDQLKEQFIYYSQNAEGNYLRKFLHVIQYYNPEFPRALIEINKKAIGTLILDGSKRLEVNVLPHTILIIELLYEADDPVEALSSASNSPGLEKEDVLEQPEAQKEETEKKDLEDMANIKAYVEKYYPVSKQSTLKTKIPPLFALAQAALETAYGVNKQGNNMFGIKASSSWKGKTLALPTHECTKTNEKVLLKMEAPNKICGEKVAFKVTAVFRAYDTVLDSFIDHGKFLQSARYKEAFKFKDKPIDFAREIAKAGYATDPKYFSKIKDTMEKIRPFIPVKESKVKYYNKDEHPNWLLLAIGGGVLILVLYFVIVKRTFKNTHV